MKTNKILKNNYLLAVILVLSLVLTACGGKNDSVEGKINEEGSNAENNKVIKVATSGKYFPYTHMEDDKLTGFDVEIWEEIGKRLGKEIQWEITSFDGMFGMLDTGKVDSAAHQISITPEREEKYKFTEVYAYNPYKLVVAEDNDEIKEIEDLEGKKFGCEATESKKQFMDRFDPEEKIERVVYSGGDYLKDIELGRIDGSLWSVLNFESAVERGEYKLKMIGRDVFNEENAFPFLKDGSNDELFNDVTKVMKEMKDDGTLEKLSIKWFDFNISESNVGD